MKVPPPRQAPPEPPRIVPVRRPRLNAQERDRVDEAAAFCADVVADGSWEQEVADRLTDQAGNAWQCLARSRRKGNCKKLAQMARTMVSGRLGQASLTVSLTVYAHVMPRNEGQASTGFSDHVALSV